MKLPFSVNKNLFALLILIYPLHILSETNEKIDDKCLSSVDDPSCLNLNKSQVDIQPLTKEDKVDSIPPKAELNSLSQFGIIDYASAVKWCRKQISENYNYEKQIERIDIHPADFCRTYFNPLIQSKSGKICVECDLDPNRIIANLFEAIKHPKNLDGSDIEISEKIYSEGNNILPSKIPENIKISLDQPQENNKTISVQSEGNNKSISNKRDRNSKENSKGYYFTGSIGANQIANIDYVNSISKITFDDGLGFDLGFGYDFGKTRIESTWMRGQSSGGVNAGISFSDDATIDSITFSGYYDFRSTKKWSPFVGLSIASTRLEISNIDDTGISYGLAFGVSYKNSDKSEIFVKSHALVTPELDYGTYKIQNGTYGIGTIGIRYRF